MPTMIKVYDLLISCPSDIAPFVSQLETAINYFNNHYGRNNKIGIRSVYWSEDTYSTMGKAPQDIINQQIVENSDMVVGVFWTRFGTPTKKYESGTEEEIEKMIEDGKQVFLYFLDKPIHPSSFDHEQYSKISKFKDKHKNDGIYFTLYDEISLARKFYEQLELYFNSLIQGADLRKNNISREVLWVDDRPENNVYERRILEQYGLDFSLALSTKQALQLLKSKDFSLIISDMGRKEGPEEGYVLLKELRKFDHETPFIIYAGSRSPEHIDKTKKSGGQGCTNEPIELVDLVIKNLLRRNQYTQNSDL